MNQTVVDTGYVVEIKGHQATVLCLHNTCNECGARLFCRPNGSTEQRLVAHNPVGARVGDRVEVTMNGSSLLRLSLLQYGLPLVGFLAGILLFDFLPLPPGAVSHELTMFGGGLLGMFAFGLISRWRMKRIVTKQGLVLLELSKNG